MSFTRETSGKRYLKFRCEIDTRAVPNTYLTYLNPLAFCNFPLSHQLIPRLFKLAKSVFEHFSVYSRVSIQSGPLTEPLLSKAPLDYNAAFNSCTYYM